MFENKDLIVFVCLTGITTLACVAIFLWCGSGGGGCC